ncbi:molybdopterin molybdochelatase [Candidatus Pelagibacter ubique]|uniref:Molybdopterin molybdenumtransferase n=1 Tax=Pelagibacter ubique TaxID=198252 RepID=A0ABX1T0H6_PELUQ|nr:molybdopterin molybdotransferase MoeA [Candidatus Pelagibacter ubique]NMN66939.1 molybdopterin molybdochelatase [Candidatus Pelagibacter ubique]
MINYKKAKKILIKSKIKIQDEIIKSSKALNRINVSDIYSTVNYPAATNAAFDGFAINSNETNKLNKKNSQNFKILKTISAGDNPIINKIKKNVTVEVMTGALIPRGFDTIIPIEKIIFNRDKKYIQINKKIKKNQHIRFAGSDYKKKDLIIKKGSIIQSAHVLAFKTLGVTKIKVKKKPNILFFSTGNEISNNKKIVNWKVRNSNSHYINSLSKNFMFNFIDGGILRDKDTKLFKKQIEKSIKSKIDIIITSGAVSAGKYDFVPYVVKKLNLSNFFKGVLIRPGKPILFAKLKGFEKAIFGLPGNPISSSACFRFFVYPYLLNILGVKAEKPFKAKLKNDYSKNKEIIRFLKARLTSTKDGKLELEVLKGQESFKIKSFVQSNVWGLFKDGQSKFKKGELIDCFSAIGPNKNFF